MAAQALSFCSNFWSTSSSSSSSSSSFQQQNHQNQHLKQNSVSFQQRKRPRPSSSSVSISPNANNFPLFSNTYSNPNTFNTNPFTPLQLQQNHYNNNPFLSNQTSFTNPNPNYLFQPDIYSTSTFFDPHSTQTLAPLHQQDHYQNNNYSSFDFLLNDVPDPILDFSSPEDQILLAPLLSESQCPSALDGYPVPQLDDPANEEIVNHQYLHDQKKKKTNSGATATVVSPQSIAARERRRKIMERTSELGKLVPGGNKMSTAEMFQAAYKYVKFLQAQVSVLQHLGSSNQDMKEQQLYGKELQVLASPIIQEKLYSEEKCLVTKEFLDRTQAQNQLS